VWFVLIAGFAQILQSPGIWKSHFPGMESHGIRPRSWNVMEMWIAGVTNFSIISLNDYHQTVKDFGFRSHPVIYNTFAFATTGTSDAKWHDNLYDVPYQCTVKVALTMFKKTISSTEKVFYRKGLESRGKSPEMFCTDPVIGEE